MEMSESEENVELQCLNGDCKEQESKEGSL